METHEIIEFIQCCLPTEENPFIIIFFKHQLSISAAHMRSWLLVHDRLTSREENLRSEILDIGFFCLYSIVGWSGVCEALVRWRWWVVCPDWLQYRPLPIWFGSFSAKRWRKCTIPCGPELLPRTIVVLEIRHLWRRQSIQLNCLNRLSG